MDIYKYIYIYMEINKVLCSIYYAVYSRPEVILDSHYPTSLPAEI